MTVTANNLQKVRKSTRHFWKIKLCKKVCKNTCCRSIQVHPVMSALTNIQRKYPLHIPYRISKLFLNFYKFFSRVFNTSFFCKHIYFQHWPCVNIWFRQRLFHVNNTRLISFFISYVFMWHIQVNPYQCSMYSKLYFHVTSFSFFCSMSKQKFLMLLWRLGIMLLFHQFVATFFITVFLCNKTYFFLFCFVDL